MVSKAGKKKMAELVKESKKKKEAQKKEGTWGFSESEKSAREKIVNSMLNLCNFTITIPLSEKTQNIRTDTFIYLEPLDFTNPIKNIYNSLTNKSGIGCRECKYVPYRHGYWYVKQVKIEYGSEQKMQLTLSPLPPVYETQYQQTNTAKVDSTTKTTSTAKKKTNTKTDDKTLVQNALAKTEKKYGHGKWKYTLGMWGNGETFSDDPAGARRHKQGDCWACSWVLAQDLNKEGVTTRIKQYATSAASNHRTVQYRLNKKWYNYPYKAHGFHSWLNWTSGVNGGYTLKTYKGKT